MKVNKVMTLRLLFGLIVMFGFASCSKSSSSKNSSTATGWKINDKKGGFQYASNYKQQPAGIANPEERFTINCLKKTFVA